MVPWLSIWPSNREAFGNRMTNTPCGLTLPSQPLPLRLWTTPFVIVNVPGTPLAATHSRDLPEAYNAPSLDTPAYLPSKAVVGVGVCAATGIAHVKAAIVASIVARPNRPPSL